MTQPEKLFTLDQVRKAMEQGGLNMEDRGLALIQLAGIPAATYDRPPRSLSDRMRNAANVLEDATYKHRWFAQGRDAFPSKVINQVSWTPADLRKVADDYDDDPTKACRTCHLIHPGDCW
jgi:hypothetical protein